MSRQPAWAVVSVSLFLLLAIIVTGWPDLEFALALEHSLLGWFQAAMLVACATVAAVLASLSSDGERWGWLLIALAILFAAIDERFMVHERLQEFLYYEWLRQVEYGLQWARAVMLAYPVGGVCALLWLRRRVSRPAWLWLRAGVVVGAGAVAMDQLFDAARPQMYEELLEYAAETLFLGGLFNEVHTRASRLR